MPDRTLPEHAVSGSRSVAGALTVVVAVLAGIGLIAPAAGLLVAMIALPVFAAMIAFVALTAHCAAPTPTQNRRAARTSARAAGTTAIGVVAVGGLADLVGAATVPILMAVGLICAPWAWSRTRHQVDRLIERFVISRRTRTDSDRSQRHG